MQELPKPWLNPMTYKKVRLEEARVEAELARKFLEQGLTRNAASKVFQACKALVAALAVDKMGELEKMYSGVVKIRGGRRVKRSEWVIAIMPTNHLKEVAMMISDKVNYMASIAILLHQYQYNGPDREGVLSPYRSDEAAENDIRLLINEIEGMLSTLSA